MADCCNKSGASGMSPGDASWLLKNAILVMTMQSGFGLLEAGCVSPKGTVSIMMKNVVDVAFGGIIYWMLGYGLTFGKPSNWFCGFGDFFLHRTQESNDIGPIYVHYIFQFSFASTATTIISGAVAERIKLHSYIILSSAATISYCISASWSWNVSGFLCQLGFHDFAGSAVVHVAGGISALVSAMVLGPRVGRFSEQSGAYIRSSPVTALAGTMILWWAFMGFNCGSTMGIEGNLWIVAAKVGINTMNSSIGSVMTVMACDLALYRKRPQYDVGHLCIGILSGLVAICAACATVTPAESFIIGAVGALLAIGCELLMQKLQIDDPVSAIPVHLAAGTWGTIAVGLFSAQEFDQLKIPAGGAIHGGGFYLMAVQLAGLASIGLWNGLIALLVCVVLRYTIGLRLGIDEEALGSDSVLVGLHDIDFSARTSVRQIAAVEDNPNSVTEEQLDLVIQKAIEELGKNKEFRQKLALQVNQQNQQLKWAIKLWRQPAPF